MIQSKFPVILFDLDNKTIPINCIAKSNSYFIKSYQKFKIEIIEDIVTENKIYSVKENPTPIGVDDLFLITTGKSFDLTNFSYTIFLTSNTEIKITGFDNIERSYFIEYRPDNVLTEAQQHYNDLLVNNYLPTYNELEPAIISNNKADIIKRLLLDYKNIISKKGTKTGITKFLNLIGFNPESIKVYDEYLVNNTTQKTITPNKKQDTKTGYYHVLYDNWINNGFTNKNLPLRIINISDLTDFFLKLEKAISLANIYFTLPEQDISFFGLNNSNNIEKYLSIAGNTSILYNMDFHYFRKKIHIDLINKQSSTKQTYLVKNNLQIFNTTFNTEIKTYSPIIQPINDELYLIDTEIYDNEIPENINTLNIISTFGNILHLNIDSVNTYCEYTIENIDNQLTKISSEKLFITIPVAINIVSKKTGNYKITVNIYDIHNNREKYVYFYTITDNIALIDFDIFNSKNILEDNNNISSDIDSTWKISTPNLNFVVPLNQIPLELSNYYEGVFTNLQYLEDNKRFMLDEINKNFIVDNTTDSIPVDYYDNWLDIFSCEYNILYDLKIRVKNDLTLKNELLDYWDLNAKNDKLFITLIDINIGDILVPYLFITTIETGINIIPELYDFVYVNKINPLDIISFYDLPNSNNKKIPVNYDFPLFFRTSTIVPNFINFPFEGINTSPLPIIKSIFPRLININSPNIETYYLELGDIITARPNNNYITEETDIIWTIRNSFTNEILFQTKDYMLKYRIKENTIYTIILDFKINNIQYSIVKSSIQSTFIQ